ncbi:TPR domain protein [mine drainage metagenome]|uniref:TPR domain protein n=3 Tax=mine drainage metagenome TaxID=410659 RepID=T0YY39_9ZZZZ
MLNHFSYTRMQRAQKLIKKKRYNAARRVLRGLLSFERYDKYPKALALEMIANTYMFQGNYHAAIPLLAEAVRTNGLPRAQEQDLLYNTAIAYANVHKSHAALQMLNQYLAGRNKAKPLSQSKTMFLAQIHYQVGDLAGARSFARQVIAAAKRRGSPPPQVAYEIILNSYVTQKNYVKSAAVLRELVRYWPRQSTFWSALANTDLELNHRKQALKVLQIGYTRGLLTSPGDIENLVKLEIMNGNASQAGTLLQNMMADHRLPRTQSNLELLVSAWARAGNEAQLGRAIREAAPGSKTGSLFLYEASICFRSANWPCVEHSVSAALQKGGLSAVGQDYLLEGTALIHMHQYQSAISVFHKALKYKSSVAQATQWLKYLKYKAALEEARHGTAPVSKKPHGTVRNRPS